MCLSRRSGKICKLQSLATFQISSVRRQDKSPPGRALFILVQLRLVMQNRVQQRTVDFDMPVVADQAKLAELVHEMADARSGGATHLGRCFLPEIRGDRLETASLAEMREQQEHAGKPPLA